MFQAYHGVTAAQHQTNFDTFSSQGYRIVSLSVYGDPGNALYGAVWVLRPGPAWVAVHGVDANGYQSFFNTWESQGFVPVLVSATGTIDDAVFAAVFEQGSAGAWFAKHGMTGPDFANECAGAITGQFIIRSFAIYGTATDRRYAAVWYSNPGYVKAHVHSSDTGASYQVTFNAETQLPGFWLGGYRPAYVTVSGDEMYCSVFKDDVVGSWVARHGMSGSDYQTFFNQQVANGLFPICTQGGGTTSAPVYASIFAQQDIPAARQWSVTGASVPALAVVDQVMQTFMQANAVRAAQIAIARGGVIQFSRAYTWAEPSYHTTQPSDRFLLASCSKMFLEAAIQSLFIANQLTPTTTVYPLLGFSNPADPRSDTITIQNLLDHSGGYDDTSNGSGFDPTYHMRDIGLAIGRVVANKGDVAGYMYGRMLDFAPGTKSVYSNYGYLLAGAVVEKVTGNPYHQYLNTALLQPAGISEVQVISTLASGRTSNEAIAEDQSLGLNPLDLTSSLLVPSVYGGDGEINEVGDPNDGLGASAEALAQFINLHAVWGNGPRSPGAARAGSTPGASTWAASRWDGLDWSYVVNTRDWPPSKSSAVPSASTSVNGAQSLTPSSFTLTVAAGGSAGFTNSGALWVTNANNGAILVKYTGIDAGANAFTGCTAPAGAGSAATGGTVAQATTVVGTQPLTQSPFTLSSSANGTQGFSNSGVLLVTNTGGTIQVVQYTGLNAAANTFTGCTAILVGAGVATTGCVVTQASLASSIDTLLNSITVP